MLYQFQNSMKGGALRIFFGKTVSYQPHLHNSFELVTVYDGCMDITVDKKRYTLHRGQSLLIFPNQIHEFISASENSNITCIFSPDLVGSYIPHFKNKIPKSNLFVSETDYAKKLAECENKSILFAKGILYSLCAEFHEKAEYVAPPIKDRALIEKIFDFIEKNYKNDCSLSALSAFTAYNYVYLSRYFKEYTGISFIEYVNLYRINVATEELVNSDKTILTVAYECGFDSLRNFNRVFKRLVGKTPLEYRTKGKL